MDILDDMGVSKLSAKVFLIELIEVNFIMATHCYFEFELRDPSRNIQLPSVIASVA